MQNSQNAANGQGNYTVVEAVWETKKKYRKETAKFLKLCVASSRAGPVTWIRTPLTATPLTKLSSIVYSASWKSKRIVVIKFLFLLECRTECPRLPFSSLPYQSLDRDFINTRRLDLV
eukprot:gnl/MRDRNA2_/MRDRNA2_9126_c0_seq1.p1 gnl/MRDRNA2_/MRDRNA2_9126_c0~~gnl/MRDRNA2_/MRDRNA2_9126_c0_seq1.p1  ORF type:complete len:118 (+),score=10.96 gnl/MRDRNA2_/MRDRNA2_9126_c0_seq1:59-412(+)